MKFRYSNIRLSYLVIVATLVIIAVLVLRLGQRQHPSPCFEKQVASANQMRECINSLKHAPVPQQWAVDPNLTKLIGVEYSPITTTLGSLKAKRTSTNPDFAALIVRWFHEIGLKENDIVAIGSSGSFPALTVATICAAEVLRLQPVIIVSLSASSYGANMPQFTYLDIERYLFDNGTIRHRTTAASLGGAGDIAADISDEGKKLLRKTIRRNDIQFIYENDLEKNIKLRSKIYSEKGAPRVFVNIGGSQINTGDYSSAQRLIPGINYDLHDDRKKIHSLIDYFSNKHIPIIHFLQIEHLAQQYDLQIDPIPLPKLPTSSIYYITLIPDHVLIISLFLCLLSFGLLIWFRMNG